jgi:SAM-dependent methyltransferase
MITMIDAVRLAEVIPPEVDLRLVEPHLYSLSAPGDNTNAYDQEGALAFYDKMACNRIYNRLVWGYSVSEYTNLCRGALSSSTEGWVLDAGCGALAFTAQTYADYDERPVVFLDQSLKLLRLAKSRLADLHGGMPENAVFLHGDVLHLPFKPKSFGTIISLNLLHVLQDIRGVLQALGKVLMDGGTMSFTTLVENHRFADRYLQAWAKAGEVVPRTPRQLLAEFENLRMPVSYRIQGNMAFISYA